jgi:hypothetical protein
VVAAVAERELLGQQEPRIRYVPDERARSRGIEAVELAESVGLHLDEWQRDVLVDACRARRGKWVAMEVGVNVGRQNGKGGILEARELAGLFAWGERLITHSAHQFDTSLEAFRRLEGLIDSSDELSRQVKRISRSHGDEGIELLSGQRIRFRTRTAGGGRGFSGDTMILDEAMFLTLFAHGALMPTLSARENPQLWYTGSAVDQDVHQHGLVFTSVRNRGLKAEDPRLAYFEWSLDWPSPMEIPEDVLDDPAAWAEANPAFGIRISEAFTAAERASMDTRTFATERLGVGDYPDLEGDGTQVLSIRVWDALRDEYSKLLNPVCLAYDVSPDRRASIAAAGHSSVELEKGEDHPYHVEIIRNRTGTRWVIPELVRLRDKHQPARILCDGYGPAASLVKEAEAAGLEVETVTSQEHAQACGQLLDLVADQQLRHLGSDELRRAIRGAKTRPLGDAWAWSRKNSAVDISPLVAGTLALGAAAAPVTEEEPVEWVSV